MAAPEALETNYYAESMSVEQEEVNSPNCVQIMFDAFLVFYNRVIDNTLGYGIVVEDEDHEDQDEDEKLTLEEIETIAELNAELEKLTDETKQCIVELEWYMQKYPDDVRLKEQLAPIAEEVHRALDEVRDEDEVEDEGNGVQEAE